MYAYIYIFGMYYIIVNYFAKQSYELVLFYKWESC